MIVGTNIVYKGLNEDVEVLPKKDTANGIYINDKLILRESSYIIANMFNLTSLLSKFNKGKKLKRHKSDALRLLGMYYITKRLNEQNDPEELWPNVTVQFNQPFNTLTISHLGLGTKYYIYIGIKNNCRVMTYYFTRAKLYGSRVDMVAILEEKIVVAKLINDILVDTDRFLSKMKYKQEKQSKNED